MKRTPLGPKLYRIGEAARLIGVGNETLIRYEDDGVITCKRLSGTRYLTAADIKAVRLHRQNRSRRIRPSGAQTEQTAG